MQQVQPLQMGQKVSIRQFVTALPTIILIAAAFFSSLSSIQSSSFFPVWGVVFSAAALAARWNGGKSIRLPAIRSFSILDAAQLCLIASGTTQAIAAVSLPTPFQKIHDTPGIVPLYIVLAGLLAAASLRLALRCGSAGRLGSALLGACLFSSTLYMRSMVVGEAGPVYGSVFAFFVLALIISAGEGFSNLWKGETRFFWTAALAFLAVLLLSSLVSPTPGDSLAYWLRTAVTIGLAAVAAVTAARFPQVKAWIVWAVILLAGAVPFLLAIVKIIALAVNTGWSTALSYRLHLTELGGGNLLAKLVVLAAPLVLYQWMLRRGSRWISAGLLVLMAGMVLTVYQALSWEGKFALAISTGMFIFLVVAQRFSSFMSRWLNTLFKRLAAAAVVLSLAAAAAVVLYQLAPSVNVTSFNGRQIHWKAALLTLRDHPFLGGGPANPSVFAPYYNVDTVGVIHVNQQILDDPFLANDLPKRLVDHAHNLFLEIVSSTGMLGLLASLAVLIELVRVGIKRWAAAVDGEKWLLAACLAGVAGELAWGVLDVIRVIPPFFSFPVWVLVGITMAPPGTHPQPAGHEKGVPSWVTGTAAVLALVLGLFPAVAAGFYSSGFMAFQEQKWQDAQRFFEQAARFEPYNPKYSEMAAETHIQLGEWAKAEQHLRAASFLRSGYSPYLYRLGWLAWMNNNLPLAQSSFEKALQEDPGEILQQNLYSSLALVNARGGRPVEAAAYFTKAAQVTPATQPGAEWIYTLRPSGGVDLVLDPSYLGEMSEALEQRIRMKLGTANLLPRQLKREDSAQSTLSYTAVLDQLQQSAQNEDDSFQASIQFAILYQTSSRSGFEALAEQALHQYQSLNPSSAYGYREMGAYYLAHGEPEKAGESLSQAVAASPRDLRSQVQLAQFLIDNEDWTGAEKYLAKLTDQQSKDAYDMRLRNTDLQTVWLSYYRSTGDLENVEKTLRSLLVIRGEPRDYLELADLERQKGRQSSADRLCLKAASETVRRWARPWDGTLFDIARCVSKSSDSIYMPQRLEQAAASSPFLGKVLVGHLYRVSGLQVRALESYQEAEALRPDEGAVSFFIAETQQVLGNNEQAEVYYRKAAELDPYESLPLVKLGQLQKAQNRKPEALKSFLDAVNLTPGWDEAQLQLANMQMELGDPGPAAAAVHYRMAMEAQPAQSSRTWFDLIPLFPFAEQKTGEIGQMYGMSFNINGTSMPVLWMHPTSEASFKLSLPSDKPAQFSSHIALSPDSWGQAGDGVTFTVRLRTQEGQEHILFEQYVDPKSEKTDRGWLPVQADLSAYAGQEVVIILATDPGPSNNYEFDWAGWGTPRIEIMK